VTIGPRPLAGSERAELLDALRGFAVFGVLLVNAPLFFVPLRQSALVAPASMPPLDLVVTALVTFFAQGKFYALFSFLFGIGAAIQLARADARGSRFGAFFSRRLLGLAAIGLVHLTLLWYGDILLIYAAVGVVLIAVARWRTRAIVTWAGLLLAAPVAIVSAIVGLLGVARWFPEASAEIDAAFAGARAEIVAEVARAARAYAEGPFAELLRTRIAEWSTLVGYGLLTAVPEIAALFLLGFVVGRARPWERLEELAGRIRGAFAALVVAGIVGSILLTGTWLLSDPWR
jgi:uncharacterized protein